MGKLPWFHFFPGDWMKDPELRSVSSSARGLWIDMVCLMFESVRRGYLVLRNNSPVTNERLARMTGNMEAKVIQWIEELESAGVCSRDSEGVIFSRRMVRDQEDREQGNSRVRKHRSNGDCNEPVTVDVTTVKRQTSEYENESEYVIDSKKEKKEEIPNDLHPMNYGAKICDELGIVAKGNQDEFANVIEVLVKGGKSLAESYQYLLERARIDQEMGEMASPLFWCRNGRWKPTANPGANRPTPVRPLPDPNCPRCAGSGRMPLKAHPGTVIDCFCTTAKVGA